MSDELDVEGIANTTHDIATRSECCGSNRPNRA